MTALRFGQYPHEEMKARRRAIEIERGMALDLSCWLNDRRDVRPPASPVDAPGAKTLEEAMGRSQWRWTGADERSTSTYFIFADDAADALALTVLFDTAVLPAAEVLDWVRGIERLLCMATRTDVGVSEIGGYTGLATAQHGAGWCQVDGSWVHLPTAGELLRRVAGTPHAEVFAVPAGADGAAAGDRPERLVAFLADQAGTDIARLHAGCVGALPGQRTTMAAHHYVVCAGAPARPGLEGWRRLRVLAEGSGRPVPGAPAGQPSAAASRP